MAILRFLIFATLLVGTYGKVEPGYNEIDRFLQLFNISLPTIKLPDLVKPEKAEDAPLPHILPTLFPPKPKDSDETNIVCDVCEYAVTNLKLKFSTLEKKTRKVLSDTVSKICNKLLVNPQYSIIAIWCNAIQTDLIKKVFDKLDKWEDNILPTTVCKYVPFCKYPKA
ncbi:hypothetical protein B9Z55_006131 [Caenorhabditis nigoni]|uniref:Saposin B-type domain-containing protein n=1 Tax=Caenorhabditis nigoni TaxID=1611254 RepID=A0A2G5V3T4_9PELO|nr:hypothetical protein B9Z55_006131 [Caenorhabditis nigoni]